MIPELKCYVCGDKVLLNEAEHKVDETGHRNKIQRNYCSKECKQADLLAEEI